MEKIYSPEEERWNVRTHQTGLLLSIAGVLALLVKASQLHSPKAFMAFLIYGIGLTAMFLASALYHAATNPVRRKRLKIFDHVAIYLTIAGSYTPITWLAMPPAWGLPILLLVWIIAACGILLKFFVIGKYSKLSTLLYVLMGWVIVIAFKPLTESMETAGLIWLISGGLVYTLGALIYQIRGLKFNHAIFHFFVLAGAACHFIVIWAYCLN